MELTAVALPPLNALPDCALSATAMDEAV